MSQEIVYTSAPKGLKPGSRGFCTVVSTDGMAGNLADRLESHSGYRHAFGVNDDRREFNPVNWSHTSMRVAGTQFHVLSRVADAGLDYSGRSNKFAHHVALDVAELPMAGPARTLLAPGVIRTEWSGEVGLVARRKLPEVPIPRSYQAATWQRVTGDPAWAGVVAEKLLESSLPLSIIFPLGADTMSLLAEVLDLLPLKQRWSLSFSTYFTQLAPGTECRLRFILDETPEAVALRKNPHAAVIDLVRKTEKPAGGELVECARSSQVPGHSLPPSPKSATPEHQKEMGQAQSHRESRKHAVEEVYDVEWDESEDAGEYAVQKPDRSTADADHQARRARRQRADEMPVSPPTKLRTVWIAGGVSVGLILFLCVAALLLQRFKASRTDAAAPIIVAKQTSQPIPQKIKQTVVTSTNKQKSAVDVAAFAQGATPGVAPKEYTVGSRSLAASNPSASPSAVDGPSTTMRTPDTGTNVTIAETTKLADRDPFESLPDDEDNPPFGLLDLAAIPKDGWPLLTRDPTSLQLELIGGEVFIRESLGKLELRKSDLNGELIWTIVINSKNQESIDLGEFRLISSKDKTMLVFKWTESVVPAPESEIVKFLVLGLRSGTFSRLCRLEKTSRKSKLAAKFSDTKHNDIELTIDMDEVLAEQLRAENPKLSIKMNLTGNITRFLVDPKDEVQDLLANRSCLIHISADENAKALNQWAAFSEQPNLALLEIKAKVPDRSLQLNLIAFATLSLFSNEAEYASAAKLAMLGELEVPKLKIPLAFGPLSIRMNRGVSKRIADAIQLTIGGLNKQKMKYEMMIQMKMNEQMANRLPNNLQQEFHNTGMRFAPATTAPLSDSQGELSWRTLACRKGFMSWLVRCCPRKRRSALPEVDRRRAIIRY